MYGDDEDFMDIGYCPRCGKDMRDESPAAVVCAGCLGDDELDLPGGEQW